MRKEFLISCGLAALWLAPQGISRAADPDPYGILLKPIPEKLVMLTFDDACLSHATFKHFGQQAYFVNLPSKFISKDGRTMWLCYSANFAAGWGKADIQSRPEGSKYALCLQELKLLNNSNKKCNSPSKPR